MQRHKIPFRDQIPDLEKRFGQCNLADENINKIRWYYQSTAWRALKVTIMKLASRYVDDSGLIAGMKFIKGGFELESPLYKFRWFCHQPLTKEEKVELKASLYRDRPNVAWRLPATQIVEDLLERGVLDFHRVTSLQAASMDLDSDDDAISGNETEFESVRSRPYAGLRKRPGVYSHGITSGICTPGTRTKKTRLGQSQSELGLSDATRKSGIPITELHGATTQGSFIPSATSNDMRAELTTPQRKRRSREGKILRAGNGERGDQILRQEIESNAIQIGQCTCRTSAATAQALRARELEETIEEIKVPAYKIAEFFDKLSSNASEYHADVLNAKNELVRLLATS